MKTLAGLYREAIEREKRILHVSISTCVSVYMCIYKLIIYSRQIVSSLCKIFYFL